MPQYTITYSLGAAKMVEAMPERAFTTTIEARDEEHAISRGYGPARKHFNLKFKGDPVLTKVLNVVDVVEEGDTTDITEYAVIIAHIEGRIKKLKNMEKNNAQRGIYHLAQAALIRSNELENLLYDIVV
jgi:hypothetical protein